MGRWVLVWLFSYSHVFITWVKCSDFKKCPHLIIVAYIGTDEWSITRTLNLPLKCKWTQRFQLWHIFYASKIHWAVLPPKSSKILLGCQVLSHSFGLIIFTKYQIVIKYVLRYLVLTVSVTIFSQTEMGGFFVSKLTQYIAKSWY